MAKRTRRRRFEDEIVQYVITVDDWEYAYSCSINHRGKSCVGSYRELATLNLKGHVLQPKASEHPTALITLSASEQALGDPGGLSRMGVGTLSARDDLLDAYVLVPAPRMGELLAIASSGRIRAATLSGTRLRYRRGTILSLHLDTSFDGEDCR